METFEEHVNASLILWELRRSWQHEGLSILILFMLRSSLLQGRESHGVNSGSLS